MKQRAQGFTLLEVAIAGAILLMGMLMVANVTRTVLDTTAPDSAQAVKSGPIVDEYLRSAVAQIKAARDTSTPLSFPSLPYGSSGTLTISAPAPSNVVTSGIYTLSEYDVSVMQGTTTLAHTKFWKLWRSDAAKAGI